MIWLLLLAVIAISFLIGWNVNTLVTEWLHDCMPHNRRRCAHDRAE